MNPFGLFIWRPDFRGLIVTSSHEHAQEYLREPCFRQSSFRIVNQTEQTIVYRSGAFVAVMSITGMDDAYKIAGMHFDDVHWHNPPATQEVYDYVRARIRRSPTPFHGPDLKTSKGSMPPNIPRLSDGGCSQCGRRHVHAPECCYKGVLSDQKVQYYTGYDELTIASPGEVLQPVTDPYPDISPTTNPWWGLNSPGGYLAALQRLTDQKSAKDTLIEHLKVKTAEGDWHAVSDAANDLRVLEAKS